MITYQCKAKDCPNKDVKYISLGKVETAECGGCKAILNGFDITDDPQIAPMTLGTPTK